MHFFVLFNLLLDSLPPSGSPSGRDLRVLVFLSFSWGISEGICHDTKRVRKNTWVGHRLGTTYMGGSSV